jgi:NADPH:quinone reductase-like Zn-dependent oxidoreductase
MLQWSVAEWGLEHLQADHVPVPEPGPGQVLVRFHAASLNYRDLLVVKGSYNPRFPRPLVPGSDGYGQIVKLGAGVAAELFHRFVLTTLAPEWKAGEPDPKTLRNTLGGPQPGVLSEYRVFRAEDLVIVEEPSALTAGEWATLPCAGVTAWTCLVDHARLQPGQTVVLLGTGGVALFGLQIAQMVGARVLLLSSSAEKRQRARQLGADAVADYQTRPDWGDWVLEQTGGRGADVVLETGGAGTLAQSLRCVKVGGHISMIGILAGAQEKLNILPLMMKAVKVQGVVVGHQEHLRQLIRACLQSFTRPVVDMAFAFEALPEALAYLASGGHFGKVVIEYPVDEEPLVESPPAV